jgi:hypothetical protein
MTMKKKKKKKNNKKKGLRHPPKKTWHTTFFAIDTGSCRRLVRMSAFWGSFNNSRDPEH